MDKDSIKHIAKLARLELTEEELVNFPKQFESILEFVGQTNEIKVETGVVRDMQNKNTFRDDSYTHENGESREEIIKGFPESQDEYLKVKKILSN